MLIEKTFLVRTTFPCNLSLPIQNLLNQVVRCLNGFAISGGTLTLQSNTNFQISFNVPPDAQDSLNLDLLANILSRDYDLPVSIERQTPEVGVKDGGLTIAISLIGVGISAIGTIISALSYWKSQMPKYSATIIIGEKPITIDTIEPNKLPELISKMQHEISLSETKILIAKK